MSNGSLLHAIAAHGLPGHEGRWPVDPLDEQRWRSLLADVAAHRVSGLLTRAVEDGALPIVDDQLSDVAELHAAACCSALAIESRAVEVLEHLENAGIRARLLKGGSVAHLDYPDPSQRFSSDVDLLVRGEDVAPALRTLAAAAYGRSSVEPRPGFDRRFGKGASLERADGYQVDLHRTFVMGPYGLRIRLEDLWARSSSFVLGGHVVHALDPDCRFLHACFHTAISDPRPRLVSQRDVAQMLLSGSLDIERIRRLAVRWRAEPVLARAVATTWMALGLPEGPELVAWAQARQPSAKEQRDLATYIDPARNSYTALSIASLAALPGRHKLAFAVALAFPRRGFIPDDGQPHRPWRRAGALVWRRMTA